MSQILKLNKLVFIFSFIFMENGKAESVLFFFVEEKKPETVFLFPGRISLLSLPCPITKALIGAPEDIKAEVDKVNKKELHILLKKWGSEPSNLILKCGNRIFIFNLIPSKSAHYDYVEVLGHISSKPFKVKSALPNTPSPLKGGLREKDFTIKKILDFSWEVNK